MLGKTKFYQHRNAFFDKATRQWKSAKLEDVQHSFGGEASRRKICGHCDQMLGKSQYYEHKRLFFDPSSNQWRSLKSTRPAEDTTDDIADCDGSSSEGTHRILFLVIECLFVHNNDLVTKHVTNNRSKENKQCAISEYPPLQEL